MHILVMDQPPMNLKRAQMIIDAETETSLSLFEPISHLPTKIYQTVLKRAFDMLLSRPFATTGHRRSTYSPIVHVIFTRLSASHPVLPRNTLLHPEYHGQLPFGRATTGSLHFDLDWSSIHRARKLSACLIEHNLLVSQCRKLITQNGTNATKLRLLHKSSPSFSKIP